MTASDCSGWTAFFDGANGTSWKCCSERNEPCQYNSHILCADGHITFINLEDQKVRRHRATFQVVLLGPDDEQGSGYDSSFGGRPRPAAVFVHRGKSDEWLNPAVNWPARRTHRAVHGGERPVRNCAALPRPVEPAGRAVSVVESVDRPRPCSAVRQLHWRKLRIGRLCALQRVEVQPFCVVPASRRENSSDCKYFDSPGVHCTNSSSSSSSTSDAVTV